MRRLGREDRCRVTHTVKSASHAPRHHASNSHQPPPLRRTSLATALLRPDPFMRLATPSCDWQGSRHSRRSSNEERREAGSPRLTPPPPLLNFRCLSKERRDRRDWLRGAGTEGHPHPPHVHTSAGPPIDKRGCAEREREREAGYRRAGSCAPALRVDNRPSAQTHGRHAGSQRQRECESAAERTRIVDLLKPDHDWVAVARFGNRRNSAAARGRWRALQDERERRRAEERERVVCEGLLTGVWPHSGRAPSAAVQQRDTSERSRRRPHSRGYQPTGQRRMSRRVPRPIAGSAHHSWNQYDSGRITRTVEPRSTISTACDAARGVARVAVSSGADHAGPPPPTLTAAPRGRHAAAVCARANCWRAAERTRRRRAWRVAPPCRRDHTVRHLAASTRLRRPPQHPPELWCNELGS